MPSPHARSLRKFNVRALFDSLRNMNLLVKLSVVPFFFVSLNAVWAGTQEEAKVVEQPPAKTTEPWEIKVSGPVWLANFSGYTGFHGVNPYVNVGVGQFSSIPTLFIRSAPK